MPGRFASPRDGVAEDVVETIRERTPVVPVAGLVLGSGLGRAVEVAARIGGRTEGDTFPFADLPGFPSPSVPGHVGELWIGELCGCPMVVFGGRVHYYEGHPMALAALTARVAGLLGARAMLLTAAVGALDPGLEPGTVVVVRDHINAMGENPLRGWRLPDGSPPFVDLSHVYDPDLRIAAVGSARQASVSGSGEGDADVRIPVAEGVYAAVSGPSYETPAETDSLRRAGGTVVGMSMVPESVAARALDMRVLGLCVVTNRAGACSSHEEVLRVSDRAAEVLGHVISDVLELI